ncbi:uncharacterized protein LY79DRAFT_348844 [Colletotrichum navitas]|uniref:Uncharacterized protein n=1 Tax=Colletotrichum navitas TaxID=681940 RepID=A0AAD8Q865_9PEZI|nr:uncharacterized protein LY79DRAFT_348844 [Colletotrichum navitas]KAK1597565.1 hypothetical protein LY79DRAFT_348844 [Colletotrichum navitas]
MSRIVTSTGPSFPPSLPHQLVAVPSANQTRAAPQNAIIIIFACDHWPEARFPLVIAFRKVKEATCSSRRGDGNQRATSCGRLHAAGQSSYHQRNPSQLGPQPYRRHSSPHLSVLAYSEYSSPLAPPVNSSRDLHLVLGPPLVWSGTCSTSCPVCIASRRRLPHHLAPPCLLAAACSKNR